jgi:alpha-tubulin suppressor-like RCC1 family protein
VALPAKAVSLVAGPQSTCATLATGELLCWGHDLRGPGRADLLAPVKLGFRQRFKAVALSQSHACGLTDKGEAYCWGNNDLGQLGTGNTALAAKPVAVLPPLP